MFARSTEPRAPNASEQAILTVADCIATTTSTPKHPMLRKQLFSVGERPVADGVDVVELASLLAVTRAVFNMHEFITRN